MLQIYNLKFLYSDNIVFTDISFTLNQGDVCVVLGRNGVGKTTLLKTISGLEKASEGEIIINNERKKFNGKIYEDVSYMRQNTNCNVELTVFEIILLAIKNNSFFVREIEKKKVKDILNELDIVNLAERYLYQLSGGQQKIIFIAQAICRNKTVLLLDEPISNLDYYNQYFVLKKIYDISKKKGIITIITLHDVNMAFSFADKVLIMSDCEMYDFGRPDEVINVKMMRDVFQIKAVIDENKEGKFIKPIDII